MWLRHPAINNLGITTTDRYSTSANPNAVGYNDGSETLGNNRYTNTFGGTSASTPIVAGIAAAMLAVNTGLSANQVRNRLRNTADKIGGVDYTGGRNDFYGYGRVNMRNALFNDSSGANITDDCGIPGETFSFTSAHNIFQPSSLAFCPAIGEIPQSDEFCTPIVTSNGNVAVICL